ncbi:MAG: 16S rRNA (cytosine(1402)-N(4))-methyltransferase, partial [Actinomycetota bacterium]
TYHSGEDRITKDVFRRRTADDRPRGLPVAGPDPEYQIVRPMARRPTADEVEQNPRAASARLRAIERTAA